MSTSGGRDSRRAASGSPLPEMSFHSAWSRRVPTRVTPPRQRPVSVRRACTSERRLVARQPRAGWSLAKGASRQRQAADQVEIQDVIAVHKHDLAALGGVEGIAQSIAGCLGDLTPSHDERMVHQNAPVAQVAVVVLGVERFNTFATEDLVELHQGARTIRSLVETVGRIHDLVDETAEDLSVCWLR